MVHIFNVPGVLTVKDKDGREHTVSSREFDNLWTVDENGCVEFLGEKPHVCHLCHP